MDVNLIWTCLCGQIEHERDSEGHSEILSLIGIADRYTSLTFPHTFDLDFFARFEGTPGATLTCAPRVIKSDGEVIADVMPGEITLKEFGKFSVAVRGVPVRFPETGSYRLEWTVGNEILPYSAELQVVQRD